MNKKELIKACKAKNINVNWYWYSEKDLEKILENGLQPMPILDYFRYFGAACMSILGIFFMTAWIMSIIESEITHQVTYLGVNVAIAFGLAWFFLPPKRTIIPKEQIEQETI